MSGIPVTVIPFGGIPVTPVSGGAPLLTNTPNAINVTIAENAAQFVIEGIGPIPGDWILEGGSGQLSIFKMPNLAIPDIVGGVNQITINAL